MSDLARPKKPLWRRVLRYLIITVVGLFLVALLARSIWGSIAASQLRKEIAKIRAVGEPLTFDELCASLPEVDPKDDAGRRYSAALALLTSPDSDKSLVAYEEALKSWPVQQPDQELQEEVRQVLADNRRTLELLDEGAALGGCRYDLFVREGIGEALKRLAPPRRAARLLSLRTIDLALRGEGDAAVDSLITSLKMLRMFDREPVLMAYLVRVAMASLVCRDTEAVLELSAPSDGSLLRLQEAWSIADRADLLPRVIRAERVLSILLLRRAVTSGMGVRWPDDDATVMPGQMPVGFWNRPLMQSMAAGYLDDLDRFARASDKPWPDVIDAVRTVRAKSHFGSLIQSGFVGVVRLSGELLALARSTRAAITIERYRRAHGKLPASLSDLVPAYATAVPVDPFTGKELRYRIEENSHAVYSLGSDGKDDGGNLERKSDERPTDWGVRCRHR